MRAIQEEEALLFVEKENPRQEKFFDTWVFFPENRQDICIVCRRYIRYRTHGDGAGPYGRSGFEQQIQYVVWLEGDKMKFKILSPSGSSIRGGLRFYKHYLCFALGGSEGMINLKDLNIRIDPMPC